MKRSALSTTLLAPVSGPSVLELAAATTNDALNTVHPETLLTRDQTAAALTAEGFPVKPKTLATKATRGGGPPYRLFGTRPLYRWGDALAWAQSRLSAPCRNTSQAETRRSV
jgi:hypothetical protein